jgi:hypothetical protein
MSAMLKEMMVPMSDLQHMTLECGVCRTAVVPHVATGRFPGVEPGERDWDGTEASIGRSYC